MEYQKKKVKLIIYIDHKSGLGGNTPPPQKKFSFLPVWVGISNFWGEFPPPPPLNTPVTMENVARVGGLKAIFVHLQRNIHAELYVPLTGHITIWLILKNQNMGS